MSFEQLIEREAKRIRSAFIDISSEHRSPSEVAHHREKVVSTFLEKYLPPSFRLGKGEIIDSNEVRSGQVDIVILSPYHPLTYDKKSMRGLFFAEGVAYSVVVEADISKSNRLENGMRQIQRIKRLERKPTFGEQRFGSDYDMKRLRRIPCILFAFRSASLPTLKRNIVKVVSSLQIPPEETFDAVVVFDRGIIYNIKDPKDKLMVYVKGQRRTGIVGCIYKEKTLINFLLYLSYTIPQEIKFSPIILKYLDKFVKMRKVKVI
jgi:hypothetical protein